MRILVVDDNRDGAESMATGLRLLHHEVRTAFNGGSAVKLSGVFRPHLVLLDIEMSGIDGYETCRVIRKLLGGGVRVVATTGLNDVEDRQRSAEAGFDAHWAKPVDWTLMKQMLLAWDPAIGTTTLR